jgi:hypothetical protein
LTIRLDPTIVPAKDTVASGEFLAADFGVWVKPDQGHFTQGQINESLTCDVADEPAPAESHHDAFHVGEAEFEAIFSRVMAKGIPYGSEPHNRSNGQINTRRGGRGGPPRSSAAGTPAGMPDDTSPPWTLPSAPTTECARDQFNVRHSSPSDAEDSPTSALTPCFLELLRLASALRRRCG